MQLIGAPIRHELAPLIHSRLADPQLVGKLRDRAEILDRVVGPDFHGAEYKYAYVQKSTKLTMLSRHVIKLAYMSERAIEMVGDRIRRVRTELKLTQKQVADAAGVSTTAVTQWESGDSKTLKPDNLFKVARLLKKSPEWLESGQGSELPSKFLFEIIEELPDDDPQQVLDFIQYRIDRATELIGSERVARYHSMIEEFKKDMSRRRKP